MDGWKNTFDTNLHIDVDLQALDMDIAHKLADIKICHEIKTEVQKNSH